MSAALPLLDNSADRLTQLFPEGVRTVFLPIVEAAAPRQVHGHEALLRGPRGLPYEAPNMAFALARSLGLLADLDRAAAQGALWRHQAMPPPRGRLFLNLHPLTAVSGSPAWLVAAASAAGIPPSRIVLELVEHEVGGGAPLTAALAGYREEGYALAVDDLGEGASGLRRILELRPDYAKFDRWLVHGAARDSARRATLGALGRLMADLGITAIAEGVEREEDLEVVVESGIPLAQGYLFGRPLELGTLPLPPPLAVLPNPEQIVKLPGAELDALPFGVVQLSADGTILQFNQYEENLSNRRAPQVLGRNFFTDVAPCTDVQEFAGRFREGVASGHLDESFDYRFAFPHGARRVRVTLYSSAATGTYWVFVRDQSGTPAERRT